MFGKLIIIMQLTLIKLGSSTGIAVNWFSTIGPLTFSYAIPLSEANTDITEKFRFQIGTSF